MTGDDMGKRSSLLTGALALLLFLTALFPLSACETNGTDTADAPEVGDLVYESTDELEYADQFSVYRYEGGYIYIEIVESDRILVVPEGEDVPEGLEPDIVVVRQPLDRIYLVATSVMALFESIDALDSISFVGSRFWYTEGAAAALENGDFLYAGKYSAPDYEMLLDGGCRLAIESTMILHNPEVKEKLFELGIPTVVERSSYEEHPLGRTEWVKFYGILLGREEEAEAVFRSEAGKIADLENLENTRLTVAFFLVNSNGNVVTYKSEGYVAEIIRIAGGEYIFPDLGAGDESKLSTVNMSMEEFYNSARDADVIIYNCSSFGTPLHSMEEFLSLSPVLEDFRAVEEGNVWSTSESLFQRTDAMGSIISEVNAILTGGGDEADMTYFLRLQ